MKHSLAISGGIDSVVLLDLMLRRFGAESLLVLHFDHGTRPSSKTDCDFVRRLADSYGTEFISQDANLGANVSEATARAARYNFFGEVARALNPASPPPILTAHHLDDLVESVAINLARGTGWRGLAVFSNPLTRQPFLTPDFFGDLVPKNTPLDRRYQHYYKYCNP